MTWLSYTRPSYILIDDTIDVMLQRSPRKSKTSSKIQDGGKLTVLRRNIAARYEVVKRFS